MQPGIWTTDMMVIAAVIACACALIGYFVAALRHGRANSDLAHQLMQTGALQESLQTQLDAAQQQLTSQQGELVASRDQAHQLEIQQSRLQAALQAAGELQARLTGERDEHKAGVLAVRQQLEARNQQYLEAVRQLEVARSEALALDKQVQELFGRLAQSNGQWEAGQAEINRLKDLLANEGKRAQALQTAEHEVREQLAEARQSVQQRESKIEMLQGELQQLRAEYTQLNTSLQEREEGFRGQMAQLVDARQSLTQEFENLANKIFEEKGKTFSQTSQAGLDHLLKPFREQIEGFQKRINEVHDASLQGNTQLNAEIRKVLDIGLQMSKEATNLTSALKGDSQQRGAWGEAQLRRTLEMSGLVEQTHYEVQSSFKDADGRHKQTDYLIKLPDGKHIIIDSKVSLVAYDRAVSAETPEAYQLAMAEHIKAVRKHIDDLSSKDYTNLIGMRSPSFVLMFMPIEPAYIEALKNNKDLFEYGYNKGIVLVSHTTLIPILRTVSNLWMIERSNAEAREISEKAGDIYNQVCIVAERLNKLGGSLTTVSNHYNDTVTALAGKQGLYGKVERFNQLSTKVSRSLPVLETTHRDIEQERLAMIVVEVNEDEVPGRVPPALPGRGNEETRG